MKNLMQFETAEQMRNAIKPWKKFLVFPAYETYDELLNAIKNVK